MIYSLYRCVLLCTKQCCSLQLPTAVESEKRAYTTDELDTMASSKPKSAIRRLMKDQEELIKFPVQNVSAAPLDSNMFEWHCNIKPDDKMTYHVILFFPDDYPYSSPSAEFVPTGLSYSGGAVQRGKKGDQICLNIFSDFGGIHREWASEKGGGWSPGYTAQTILLNVVSFLAEFSNGGDGDYAKHCRKFNCSDCGHSFSKPFPSVDLLSTTKASEGVANDTDSFSSQIVDYISKEKFNPSKTPSGNELFGYGLVLTQHGRRSNLTTPCEFLTTETFYSMKKSKGVIHSIMKEELAYFLPLYINKLHGSQIRKEFEKVLTDVQRVLFPGDSRVKPSYADIIIQLIPNLMCSTVVEFSKGSTHTSDSSLQGYFALHRLFIWAMGIYPELEKHVEKRLDMFVSNPAKRSKDSCPDIGQWLMLLSVSKRFTWQSVAEAYLSECYRRNVMWYLKSDQSLGNMSPSESNRLNQTFQLTAVSRNLLAFQVAFLKIAKPDALSMEQILDRYEANLGFPNADMVTEMKSAFQRIQSEVKDYKDWYDALGLVYPSNASLFETLKTSVQYAKSTKGYFFTQNNNRPRR